jgi:hypothetical protein
MNNLEWVGWIATAVFASSYFCKSPGMLRKVQAGAALMWIAYGMTLHALPVVVSNAVVLTIALFSLRASREAPAQ